MYLNGTTDRSYTVLNRQVAHKYGTITLQPDNGPAVTEVFKDFNQQAQLQRRFYQMRRIEYNNEATIYLTLTSRMDTNKARAFLDEVAEKVGFNLEVRSNQLAVGPDENIGISQSLNTGQLAINTEEVRIRDLENNNDEFTPAA